MSNPFAWAALVVAAAGSCYATARAGAPEAYAAFTAAAQPEHGLFTIWQKSGKTYLELAPSQLDTDYLETIAPGNGLAQGPVWWGDDDYLPTEPVRFERRGDEIVILWPNWYARAPGNASAQLANEYNFPDSVVGAGPIAAENAQNGDVIFDASSLLGDVLDMKDVIDGSLPPGKAYRLNAELSYFDAVKAFPDNDVITVAQTWQSEAQHVIDTAPDSRSLKIDVVYNFVQIPHDDYRPRLADDRVGIYDDVYDDFSNDRRMTRRMRYIVRWNFDPATPGRPSIARHPMIMYLSNTVPPQYRQAIADACLEWNKAFAKIGILDAVQVRPQPDDPHWDPDDVRYNVIRWLNEVQPGFGADSNTLFNPLTGEEIRTGVLVSAVEGYSAYQAWHYDVDPIRFGRTTDPVPAKFVHDEVFSALVHEMGHNMGLQHNFIGSDAYTAEDLQSTAFTRRYGIATSVMEYAPMNVWPRGTPNGEYFQTTIGPYDYYAIKYGYAYIPGAATPEQEVSTLRRWASQWSNPLYRYASDEDVAWGDGHASDPRVEQGDLTNDTLGWCEVQMRMYRSEMNRLDSLFPQPAQDYETETNVFAGMLGRYLGCAGIVSHFIGGEYLSRAHRGDPGAAPPIVPEPLAQERRAFSLLDRYLFEGTALEVSPRTLQHLGYSEWAGYGYTSWPGYGNLPLWAYNPPERHDFSAVDEINAAQRRAIDFFFRPLVLQRIDENPLEARAPTMTIADLFDWLHAGIYGDLRERTIPLVSRNLQALYVEQLDTIVNNPAKGTPADAQALARTALQRVARDAASALHSPHDAITAAHLRQLAHNANVSLSATSTRAH